MSDEYTPTTAQVRNGFSMYRHNADYAGTGHEEFDRWLAEYTREVAATERQRIAQLVERQRPEMGMHINVSEYRRGKDDALVIALVAIREGRS